MPVDVITRLRHIRDGLECGVARRELLGDAEAALCAAQLEREQADQLAKLG